MRNLKKYLNKQKRKFTIDEEGLLCFGDKIKIAARDSDYYLFVDKGASKFSMSCRKNELEFNRTMVEFLLQYIWMQELVDLNNKKERKDG